MAQILKTKIKNAIIIAAKEEFALKGFIRASLRNIAKNSGASLSNIYNYFEDKDDLFKNCVYTTINSLEEMLNNLKNGNSLTNLDFDKSTIYFEKIIKFVEKNKEELKLLAFESEGSNLQEYLDEWINKYSKFEYQAVEEKFSSNSDLFENIPSEFFIMNLCKFFFNSLLELIKHDLSSEDFEAKLKEIFSFIYQGWDYYANF